ncbi:katanin p60 ATPase-containing subunit A-like 2 [Octopus bimaculoides]|nr:katanin p60 ATPase-containing subunit A-like 2 [Octopus bimaculoides]|eukprot:XP_014767657.1 PREDICTED: katanin p60 ATPase-containing subunit A-like 2 [Octopus bimaculoides]
MSTGLSYQGLRCAHQAREAEELKTSQRRKNLLILIIHYLTEQGYRESADCLTKETNIDVNRYETCDNIDLETILMDFENYYHLKFSKYPKLTKASLSSAAERRLGDKHCRSAKSSTTLVNGLPQISGGARGHISPPLANPYQTSGRQKLSAHQTKRNFKSNLIIDFRALLNGATKLSLDDNLEASPQDRLLKPLGGYMGYNNEWRDLAQLISREIYVHNPNLGWNDIIGLDEAKRLVKEAVVYPIKYPSLFKGILSPWKGLLLYGPPGTGKTLLAKAVATECNTTFFNISASSIVSKWRGDSEKLVRVLFELARFHAPSTIFLDELDSLMSQRGSNGQGVEHEGSRRMKTELLVQMDGLAKTDELVFLLTASNLPWELDNAMLRRLEKRILVGLPKKEARQAMFNLFLPNVVTSDEGGPKLCTDLDYDLLAQKTEGYSGSDIKLVCKEAAMRPMRKIFDILENNTADKELNIQLDTLTTYDVEMALERTKPSARGLVDQYAAWQKEFESV